jgi:hypothetical protein
MRRSFSFSPSSILATGTPVQRSTTSAICSGRTASSTMTSLVLALLGLGQLFLQLRDHAVAELPRLGQITARLA